MGKKRIRSGDLFALRLAVNLGGNAFRSLAGRFAKEKVPLALGGGENSELELPDKSWAKLNASFGRSCSFSTSAGEAA